MCRWLGFSSDREGYDPERGTGRGGSKSTVRTSGVRDSGAFPLSRSATQWEAPGGNPRWKGPQLRRIAPRSLCTQLHPSVLPHPSLPAFPRAA